MASTEQKQNDAGLVQDDTIPPLDTTPPEEHRGELNLRSGLATAGAALCYFVTVGFTSSFGLFQEYYISSVLSTHSAFQIAWIGSFSSFAIFAVAPAAGILADRFGPRLPIVFGSICILLSVFMTSLCKEYYQFFLAQGVLLGVGQSFVAVPASGMVPRYFVRNRGLATGVSVAGSSLGGVCWPIIFDQLLHTDNVSFAWSMRIAGFIMLPLLVVVTLCVRLPIKSKNTTIPGPTVDGASEEMGEKAEEPAPVKKDLSMMGKPPFILLCSGLFLAYLGFFTPYFFISTYAAQLGRSQKFGFYLVSIINAASLFGRVLPGILADRWGRFNTLVVSCLTASLVAFCWTKATSNAGLVVWALAFGFSSGAVISLQLACATSLGTADTAGAVIGVTMGSVSLACLFGPPISGQLVKSAGYIALSCFSGAMLAAGGLLIGCSRLAQTRNFLAAV